MLEKVDLAQTLDKKSYKQIMPVLSEKLFRLQQASWDAGQAVVIAFEGWDAAGKGAAIQKLSTSIDPRGFKVYPIRSPRAFEKKRPWMWRFWVKMPGSGEWAIFDRSWYRRITNDRLEAIIPEKEWRRGYRDIVDFERTLVDDGYLLLKFFLHISRQEQKRRFDRLSGDAQAGWRISAQDWERYRRYDDWTTAWEEVFDRTDTEWAPWTIVEATDSRFAWAKIYRTIVGALAEKLDMPQETQTEPMLAETWLAPVDEAAQETLAFIEPVHDGSEDAAAGDGCLADENIQEWIVDGSDQLENVEKDA